MRTPTMPENNNAPHRDDLSFALMMTAFFMLFLLPMVVIQAARVAPDRLSDLKTARVLFGAIVALCLAAVLWGVTLLFPEQLTTPVLSLGKFSLRFRHVCAWLEFNLALFALVYGSLPYWQRWIPRAKDLRSGLY